MNDRATAASPNLAPPVPGQGLVAVEQFHVEPTCSVDGCTDRVKGRGLCNRHWKRWRNGSPLTAKIKKPDGAGYVRRDGYIVRTVSYEAKYEHVRVVERVLGKVLLQGAVVHHVNENRLDNRTVNLVICQNNAYHRLLHARMDAMKACGHAHWRKCRFCKRYDDPSNLCIYVRRCKIHHRECDNKDQRDRRKERI